jgi:hypothetical protein
VWGSAHFTAGFDSNYKHFEWVKRESHIIMIEAQTIHKGHCTGTDMISQHPPYDCTACKLAMRETVNIKLLHKIDLKL